MTRRDRLGADINSSLVRYFGKISGCRAHPSLDLSFLINQARDTVLQVAAEHQIYVSSNALHGVDALVELRLPELSDMAAHDRFDFDRWKKHITHVAVLVAKDLRTERKKRLDSEDELVPLAKKRMV